MEANFFETLARSLWSGFFSDTWLKPNDLIFFVLLGLVGYVYFHWSSKRKLDEVLRWEFPGTREESQQQFIMHRLGLFAQIVLVGLIYIALRNWAG